MLAQVQAELLLFVAYAQSHRPIHNLENHERSDKSHNRRGQHGDKLDPELTAFEANRPVANAPHIPPTPWMPTTSSESSYPRRDFTMIAPKQRTPAPAPMRMEEIGPTNPDAGVIATRPATAPLAAPR